MNRRLWLTASIRGIVSATPVALVLFNLGILAGRSRVSEDLTSGMIFLGVALVSIGGLIQTPGVSPTRSDLYASTST